MQITAPNKALSKCAIGIVRGIVNFCNRPRKNGQTAPYVAEVKDLYGTKSNAALLPCASSSASSGLKEELLMIEGDRTTTKNNNKRNE